MSPPDSRMPGGSMDGLAEHLQAAVGGGIEVRERIGEGRAGVLYRGHEGELDRPVAIKVLLPRYAEDPKMVARFKREARAMAGCPHPSIVPVHAVGETELGVPFFVMDYIDGETLADRIARRGRLPPPEAARIVAAVADALTFAHERGLIHRDVKPANIMIERSTGRVILTDFGLAKLTSRDTRGMTLTGQGEIIGEPGYMSPEQADHGRVDARSDQYSLAVVAYHALAGRPPFSGPELEDYVRQHGLETPEPLASAAPDVPPDVARVIDRALMKEPGARFASADAFGESLAAAARTPASALPSSRRADGMTWRQQRVVLQAAMVYVGAAWGALEIMSWVLETFGLPSDLRQPALWIAVAGLPIVLAIVWYRQRTSTARPG